MNLQFIKSQFLVATICGLTWSAMANVHSNNDIAAKLGANTAAEVDYSKGEVSASKNELSEVSAAITSAKTKGEIDEVRIIAWADQEYPPQGAAAPESSEKLAEERAEKLKDYIEDNLKVDSVRTFNMAKRPNDVQDFLNTPSARLKDKLEVSGAAPTGNKDKGLFNLNGKASKTIVLVYLK